MSRFIENVTSLLKEVAEMQGLELSIRHESLPGSIRGTREIMESTFKFVKDDFTIVSSTHVVWGKVTGDTFFDVVRCILMDLKKGVENVTIYPCIPKLLSPSEIREELGYKPNITNYGKALFRNAIPAIDKVIFNDPATIIMWADGTKTVVKAVDEAYDPEKGMAMAISRKALGNKGNYYNVFEEWLPEELYASEEEVQKVLENVRDAMRNMAKGGITCPN